MNTTLKKGYKGSEIKQIQQLLNQRGYPVEIDGKLENETYKAVRTFQSQNLDQHGQPLVIDGSIGQLT